MHDQQKHPQEWTQEQPPPSRHYLNPILNSIQVLSDRLAGCFKQLSRAYASRWTRNLWSVTSTRIKLRRLTTAKVTHVVNARRTHPDHALLHDILQWIKDNPYFTNIETNQHTRAHYSQPPSSQVYLKHRPRRRQRKTKTDKICRDTR